MLHRICVIVLSFLCCLLLLYYFIITLLFLFSQRLLEHCFGEKPLFQTKYNIQNIHKLIKISNFSICVTKLPYFRLLVQRYLKVVILKLTFKFELLYTDFINIKNKN